MAILSGSKLASGLDILENKRLEWEGSGLRGRKLIIKADCGIF